MPEIYIATSVFTLKFKYMLIPKDNIDIIIAK